jgi:hypothetical protein
MKRGCNMNNLNNPMVTPEETFTVLECQIMQTCYVGKKSIAEVAIKFNISPTKVQKTLEKWYRLVMVENNVDKVEMVIPDDILSNFQRHIVAAVKMKPMSSVLSEFDVSSEFVQQTMETYKRLVFPIEALKPKILLRTPEADAILEAYLNEGGHDYLTEFAIKTCMTHVIAGTDEFKALTDTPSKTMALANRCQEIREKLNLGVNHIFKK